MPSASTGIVSKTAIQNLRLMSASSGFSSSSSDAVSGSSAIPQIGQLPGPSRMISGCIGQVYCCARAPSSVVSSRAQS